MGDAEDPQTWWPLLKQIWDFGESVASDTLAPWVNRAMPHLVSPAFRMVRAHTPAVRRIASRQLASVRDALIDLLRIYRRNRIAQVGGVILVAGIALGETPAALWAPVVVGPPLMLYLCWGLIDGFQRRARNIFNVLR